MVPYNKGGDFRKWYGNSEHVVNWEYGGREVREYAASKHGSFTKRIVNMSDYFKPSISWSKISSSNIAMRYYPSGYVFDVAGCSIFSDQQNNLFYLLGLTNTFLIRHFLSGISPTLNFEVGQIAQLPVLKRRDPSISDLILILINKAQDDWNSYEFSWDFAKPPLLLSIFRHLSLANTYNTLRTHWHEMTLEMQRLEEENNRLFIEAYGLQDELNPDVPLSEITLTCNPYYRYGAKKSEAELETLLLADTMREFISYAVGCMFGRYSLDKPGLILANQGEAVADYLSAVGRQPSAISFMPDKDNAIPILDSDWFPDDISERFKRFLRLTFGESHYEENLAFLEKALGRDIQGYFLREFYDDHVKRYQKRPIYWLFSSPKGSFNVLIYMHRYRPDTVSVVLNDYLREFRAKLNGRKTHLQQVSISTAATPRDKTNALKEIDKLDKTLRELADYENDILYPLATQQVQIDLDDGVKVNYNKFGRALKPIAGLSEK